MVCVSSAGWEVYLFFARSSPRFPTCSTYRQLFKSFLDHTTTFCAA